ncbi:MAG TPA: cyclic pyranopterin monophosphate synthase MoaC [Planctomycetota bacterium]|nr:cyclic pyranopterin monophosphate synthase MoaC [Planctomycetota bacterium]
MSDDALSHLSGDDAARMVDVGGKPVTRRRAVAEAWVTVGAGVAALLRDKGAVAKGNVLDTARLAGILAAKHTASLIPMCHPVPLDVVEIDATLEAERVRIVTTVSAEARTGVEMEAMTAAAVAALTVYDMVKSAGKGVEIGPVRLLEKEGGRSGHWRRDEESRDAES